jgi:prepilin-type N-terminal cleavage/methylation domain-containing protein
MRKFLAGISGIRQKFRGRPPLCPADPEPRRRGRDEGFSLLEVLVATIIMGLVMVVILQVLSATLRAQESSLSHTRAVMVAEKVLEEYCGLNKPGAGTFDGQEGRYAYRVRLSPQFEVVPPNQGVRATCLLIEVTVSWVERGRTKSLELLTMRTVGQKKT